MLLSFGHEGADLRGAFRRAVQETKKSTRCVNVLTPWYIILHAIGNSTNYAI